MTVRLVQLLNPLRRWFCDDRGVAAVEAALIAPVAVALLGLLAIWAQGIAIQRKVTLTARTITDLVSQQGTQSNNACSVPSGNPSTYASVNRSRRSTTCSTTRRTSSTPTSNRIRERTR